MSECIEWTNSKDAQGYGFKRVNGVLHRVHRLEYTKHHGPIPKGMSILHSCDNPSCYNIEHLSLGTHQDNMADMKLKGRATSPKGMNNYQTSLTDDDVRAIRASSISQRKLAKLYGVSQASISSIVLRKTWRHI